MSESVPGQCPYRGPLMFANFQTKNGVVKPLFRCNHKANRKKRAVEARCAGCLPKPEDPPACSHCPWFDLATGEERPVPLPFVMPTRAPPQPSQATPKMMRVVAPSRGAYTIRREVYRGDLPSSPKKAIRKAVLSYAIGRETCEQQAITIANQRAYAERTGADFISRSYPDRSLPYAPGIKWEAVAEHAHRYDQTLLLDPDVVIRKCAPNIFDFVPVNCWGVTDERPYLRDPNPAMAAQEKAAADLRIESPWMPHIFNGGVLVMPNDAITVFHEENVAVKHWSRDQAVLSARLMAGHAEYRILDPRFNACWHYRDHDPSRAWFIHRSGQNQAEGYAARLRGLRMDVEAHRT